MNVRDLVRVKPLQYIDYSNDPTTPHALAIDENKRIWLAFPTHFTAPPFNNLSSNDFVGGIKSTITENIARANAERESRIYSLLEAK